MGQHSSEPLRERPGLVWTAPRPCYAPGMGRRIILHVVTAPLDLLVAYPAVLLAWLFIGRDLWWSRGVLSCELTPKASKIWGWGGMTLGHGIVYADGRRGGTEEADRPIEVHELVHARQAETAALAGFVAGLVVAIVVGASGSLGPALWLGGLLWLLTPWLMVGAAWLSAWLRGEHFYRDSDHEMHAYAIDRLFELGERERKR